MLAVPAASAQRVVDLVVASGIKAVLNFSPGALQVPADVKLKSVDLTVSLESLSFLSGARRKRCLVRAGASPRARLSHVDARGRVQMVDVGAKAVDRSRGDRAEARSPCRARR